MMSEPTRALLLRTLIAQYEKLKDRLANRVGSVDLASDALQETWLRLDSRDDLGPVKNPTAYVYRAALNTANNLRKSNQRRLTPIEIADLLAIPDSAPGPDVIAEMRAEIAKIDAAIAELTERQRNVFLESFLGDTSHRELAERWGVSMRMIQLDLKHAVEHCGRRLGKRNRFALRRVQLSKAGRDSGVASKSLGSEPEPSDD